jgi:RNA polymerase sigma factor (sigma-70 family)
VRLNGPISRSEEEAIDPQVVKTFAGLGKENMQNRNTYGERDGREAIGGEQGTVQQLEQILASGLPSLYRRAYRILGNAADAEDAVQDALLAAYKHLGQFKRQSQLSTWLIAIVLNCARMQLRRRPRYVHVSLEESTVELQSVSVSEQLADHRPNPEHEFIESELKALQRARKHLPMWSSASISTKRNASLISRRISLTLGSLLRKATIRGQSAIGKRQ